MLGRVYYIVKTTEEGGISLRSLTNYFLSEVLRSNLNLSRIILMSLSVLVRSAAIRQQALRARSLHTTVPIRADHGHYHVRSSRNVHDKYSPSMQHLPFQFPGERKALFGFKLFVYMATGFSLPFLAARHQL